MSEEMCITASNCLALDLFKEGLREMSLGGIMQIMVAAHPVYKYDRHRSSRSVSFSATVWISNTEGIDVVRASATCQVESKDGQWLSGVVTITAVDQMRTFSGEIQQDGKLVLTESSPA